MLQYEKKTIPQGIEWLSKRDDIYIYGCGAVASQALQLLSDYSICINGTLVSDAYYPRGESKDKKFINAKIFLKEYTGQGLTLIIGFDVKKHSDLFLSLLNNEKIKQLVIVDGCGFLFGNGFQFPSESKIRIIDSYYNGILRRDLSYDYYMEHKEEFFETYNWLSDEKSKNTMDCYLRGHIELEEFSMRSVWIKEDVKDQYFPDDIITMSNNETFIDCGAYVGDTLSAFLERVSNFRKYIAFEPDIRCFGDLESVRKDKRIIVEHLGVWSEITTLRFSYDTECGEISSGGGGVIPVTSIDEYAAQNNIETITFIKMDIEGAEFLALQGAKISISKYKPKLAICVYHKREDLITIPRYIKKLNPEYKLFLRAHFPYVSELVLYAI